MEDLRMTGENGRWWGYNINKAAIQLPTDSD